MNFCDVEELGWLTGFEPATTGITIQDSTVELQPPRLQPHPPGLPDRTRTCDPQLRRLVLYPAELRADPDLKRQQKLVGVERFELPTSCSQSRRATRLRYTPRARNDNTALWADPMQQQLSRRLA